MWSRFAMCVVSNKTSNQTASFQKTVASFPLSRITANKLSFNLIIRLFDFEASLGVSLND